MNLNSDAAVLNALVRMVVPMRREFGCTVDVQQARRDKGYARQLIEQAMTSRVQRLRDYASFVDSQIQETATPPAADTDTAAPSMDPRALATLAARGLIDVIGPMGEPLAMRLEAARDADTVSALVRRAHDTIAQVRGQAAAGRYLHRLGDWQPTLQTPDNAR